MKGGAKEQFYDEKRRHSFEKFRKEKEEKKVKNKVFLILLTAVLAISLSILGCGEVTPLPPEISLVFSDHNPNFNACAQALTTYANYIAGHSDGKIEITKIGYGGEILPQLQAFEGVQAGTADCASYVPEIGDGLEYIQVMNLPFMGWGTPRERGSGIRETYRRLP